jgi:hypothetical protein
VKRLLLLIVAAAAAGFLIWLGLRSTRGQQSGIAELLPSDTAILVHLPDLNETRDQWHRTDLYQLWREPAVQAFVQKPLTKLPPTNTAADAAHQFMKLDPKDLFVAVTFAAGAEPKVTVGFRFKGNAADVEKVVGRWRENFLANASAAKRESADYQGHAIETTTMERFSVSCVYDRDWFLSSNDAAGLKIILDRVDGRLRDRKTSLEGDEIFLAARAHMPRTYAALMYVQPQRFTDYVAPMLATSGRELSADQLATVRQIRSFCGTTSFDGGKLRDVSFVTMPEVKGGPLARASLPLSTADTFLYSAFILNLATQAQTNPGVANAATGGGFAAVQQMLRALSSQGINLDQWKSAFGDEIGIVGDWVQNARWPSALVSLPIRDRAKAVEIVEAVTKARNDQQWTREDAEGVTYYSLGSMGGFVAMAPTIAVGEKVLVAGLDLESVKGAVKRTGASDAALTKSRDYQAASKAVAEPTNAFVYVDTKTLFERLDVAVRPLLLMSAAFVPALSQNADFTKLPPAKVITKHLSPIVMSQRYEVDGYLTESTGPITLNQAALGVGAGIAASFWRNAVHQ